MCQYGWRFVIVTSSSNYRDRVLPAWLRQYLILSRVIAMFCSLLSLTPAPRTWMMTCKLYILLWAGFLGMLICHEGTVKFQLTRSWATSWRSQKLNGVKNENFYWDQLLQFWDHWWPSQTHSAWNCNMCTHNGTQQRQWRFSTSFTTSWEAV